MTNQIVAKLVIECLKHYSLPSLVPIFAFSEITIPAKEYLRSERVAKQDEDFVKVNLKTI